MELIDTHAHLDEDAFNTDRDEVVARAVESGLSALISISTTAQSSRQTVALAARHRAVYAAVGIHPNYFAQAKPGDWDVVEQLAASSAKVAAIGETGLDRYRDYSPFNLQTEYFAKHIELARRHDLPFIVHCRESEDDVAAQLGEAAGSGPLRGVMHSFSGNLKTARTCLELGLYISFSGMLTFKKSDELRAVAAEIPLERLLVETDAPYLSPTPNRGKRNEPAYVRYTTSCLAEVHGVSLEEMAAQTTRNARELFRL